MIAHVKLSVQRSETFYYTRCIGVTFFRRLHVICFHCDFEHAQYKPAVAGMGSYVAYKCSDY